MDRQTLEQSRRLLGALLVAAAWVGMPGVATTADARQRADRPHQAADARTVERSRGADGVIDSTVTGARGNTRTVDRSRGADGVVDSTVTGAKGNTRTADRSRGTDGVVDSTVTGAQGAQRSVDRSRNADGTVSKTVTTTPRP